MAGRKSKFRAAWCAEIGVAVMSGYCTNLTFTKYPIVSDRTSVSVDVLRPNLGQQCEHAHQSGIGESLAEDCGQLTDCQATACLRFRTGVPPFG